LRGASEKRRRTITRTESDFARVNGTELRYDVTGAGPPVALLHAALGDRRLWDAQVEPFSKSYTVVRYDARGYGDSPLPGGPFSYVDDLRALFDHLQIERAAVIGNSLGGKAALEFALLEPERVSALVLVDSGLGGQPPSATLQELDAQEDALLDAGKLDEAVELNLRAWLADDVDPGVRERVAAMQKRSFEVILAAYEREPEPGPVAWLEDPPAAGRLDQVQAPTLVLVGDRDQPDFVALADRLAEEIPRARKEVIAGAGHLPGLERPADFNRIVLDFLAGL
jgi:3-oxoadipate enol-lactonase